MKLVSLICTIHAEMGRANVSELHAILERVRPEVIFLEAPVVSVSDKFDIEQLGNMESAAVIRYRKGHPAILVPVDIPTPDESFFRRSRELFGDLPRQSYEYDRLMEKNKENVEEAGFVYLNGERHSEYQSELHEETIKTLEKINNSVFSEFYGLWIKTKELREREMILNIARYCRENEFSRSAFLVGAAHRTSVIEKSKEQSAAIHWDYSGSGAW